MSATRVLVTGGTGTLGRELVPRLLEDGRTVRVMSRGGARAGLPEGVEWARADLASGEGLAAAVEGADVVIHAASDPRGDVRATDIEGTRRLLEAAGRAGVGHFVFVSIVGVDGVPFPYYRLKVEIEGMVRASGLPWTVMRATQWHDFIEIMFLAPAARVPWVMPVPAGWRTQPVEVGEVAARLAATVGDGPLRDTDNFTGPEARTLDDLARAWLEIRGIRRRILPLPIPGGMSAAMRQGRITLPERHDGTVTWEQWVRAKYGAPETAVAGGGVATIAR